MTGQRDPGPRRPCRPPDRLEDGGPRSDLKIPFARCGDGLARHASKTDRAGGPFTCLGCGEPLVYRQSARGRPHFAHKPGSHCSGETALHEYAKDILAQHRSLTVPELVLRQSGLSEAVRRTERMVFDRVQLEHDLKSVRPDALVHKGANPLGVEFRVTHKVDAEKRAKLLALDLSTLEIDLSRLRTAQLDADALDEAILNGAPRHWVHHRSEAARADKLRQRVKDRDDAKKNAIQARLSAAPKLAGAAARYATLVAEVRAAGLGEALGITLSPDHWFTVPPALWQAMLLVHYVIRPARLYSPRTLIRIKPAFGDERLSDAFDEGVVRPDLADLTDWKIRDAGMKPDDVGDPDDALYHYMARLSLRGEIVAWDAEKRRYHIAEACHERLHRVARFAGTVQRALGAAKVADVEGVWRAWSQRAFEGGPSPAALAEAGGAAFDALDRRIAAIVAMDRGWDKVVTDDLCGLPVEPLRDALRDAIAVAEAAKAKAAADAADGRRRQIGAAARSALADEAPGFLAALAPGAMLSWADSAAQDEAGLMRARRALDAAADARTHRLGLQAEQAAREKRLRADTGKAFADPVRAKLFLENVHPKLDGRRPLDCCDDPGLFQRALAQLPRR